MTPNLIFINLICSWFGLSAYSVSRILLCAIINALMRFDIRKQSSALLEGAVTVNYVTDFRDELD